MIHSAVGAHAGGATLRAFGDVKPIDYFVTVTSVQSFKNRPASLGRVPRLGSGVQSLACCTQEKSQEQDRSRRTEKEHRAKQM